MDEWLHAVTSSDWWHLTCAHLLHDDLVPVGKVSCNPCSFTCPCGMPFCGKEYSGVGVCYYNYSWGMFRHWLIVYWQRNLFIWHCCILLSETYYSCCYKISQPQKCLPCFHLLRHFHYRLTLQFHSQSVV